MEFYLSKRAKIIIGVVVALLLIAGAIGGSIAIANAVKKDKQSKCEHVYDEGKIKVEATCEDVGVMQYKCSECGYVLSEEIPANGHVDTVIQAVEATCTSKGATDGLKCITCDEVLVAPVETPMLGHKVEALKAVAATCTTAGKTEGAKCTRCDTVLKEQTVIPAKGHTVVELKGVAPTCTEAGKTNGSQCSACGIVYSAQETIPALGHNVIDGNCTVCGAQYASPYVAYAEKSIEGGSAVAGRVFRVYKEMADSSYDGNFLIVDGEFDFKVGNSDYSQNRLYLGLLSNGDFVISFEPIQGSMGRLELTAQNTTMKFYETDEYIDFIVQQNDTITFDGVSLYGGEMVGTFSIGTATTAGVFSGGIYLLESPASTVLN